MMTIGEIFTAMSSAASGAIVKFDFGGICPTKVCSWRGDYAEAAIEFTDGSYCQHWTTVEEFRNELILATDGRTYSGWKGGEYSYGKSTPLHVDNHGNCSNTEIVRVEVEEYQVVLHTEYKP